MIMFSSVNDDKASPPGAQKPPWNTAAAGARGEQYHVSDGRCYKECDVRVA